MLSRCHRMGWAGLGLGWAGAGAYRPQPSSQAGVSSILRPRPVAVGSRLWGRSQSIICQHFCRFVKPAKNPSANPLATPTRLGAQVCKPTSELRATLPSASLCHQEARAPNLPRSATRRVEATEESRWVWRGAGFSVRKTFWVCVRVTVLTFGGGNPVF